MEKIKITRKEVEKFTNYQIQVGYCQLQHLLSYMQPYFFNCGTYGWNWNCYIIETSKYGRVAITTGYRGTFGINISNEIVNQFDDRAKGKSKEYCNMLLSRFLQTVLENK